MYWPSEKGEPQALKMLHEKQIDMVVNIPRDLSAGELDNGYKDVYKRQLPDRGAERE